GGVLGGARERCRCLWCISRAGGPGAAALSLSTRRSQRGRVDLIGLRRQVGAVETVLSRSSARVAGDGPELEYQATRDAACNDNRGPSALGEVRFAHVGNDDG